MTKKTDHLPNIYRVFFRSLIYILGFVIFSFPKESINGLINGENISTALKFAFHELYSPSFITSFVGIFIAFLFFNTFWVIRTKVGPVILYDMFFKR